ncbi:MAG TPA: M48 family metalloprotease, partial [Candidatus Binatia bacterium]|nr:M48 family metalloprotease [Candidatus Binatia bacterium]
EVGNRVLATSHLRRPGADEQVRATPVTFTVLDSPVINAMALPGGYIYVTRGMLAHLNNEDQLATVIAHEIGHVAARHAARQAWQQQIGQGLLLGGAVLSQGLGLPAGNILNFGGMAAQLFLLRYSREDELEADRLGVEYAMAAGYDSREVIGLFQTLDRMQEKEGQSMPSFLATHPNPGDRIQRIRELTNAARDGRTPNPDTRFLHAVEGLVLGEDPRQGFVQDNVFYHPDLGFRFPIPRGFKAVNQPSQVVMVEGQNRAVLGFTGTAESSAEAAAAKLLSQRGLRVVERGSTRINGFPAVGVLAEAQTQNGQIVTLTTYFIEYRGKVYQFIGYAPQQLFGSFQSAFLQTIRGFAEIQDSRILARQPVRLTLLRVPRSAPFRELIPRALPAPFTPEEAAILNEVDLNQEISPGKILKIPSQQ